MADTKRCSRCQETKSLEDFATRKGAVDGLRGQCQACRRAVNELWRDANKERKRDKDRAYYLATREHQLEVKRAWYEGNREKQAAAGKAWRETNREANNQRIREWHAANPGKDRTYRERWIAGDPEHARALKRAAASRRRSRKREQFVENVDDLIVLEMDDGVCGVCGDDVDPTNFEVDHVVPLALGGEHSYANTQPTHPACNRRKHVRLVA